MELTVAEINELIEKGFTPDHIVKMIGNEPQEKEAPQEEEAPQEKETPKEKEADEPQEKEAEKEIDEKDKEIIALREKVNELQAENLRKAKEKDGDELMTAESVIKNFIQAL